MLTLFVPPIFVRTTLVFAAFMIWHVDANANSSAEALSNCRSLTDAADRLACYDQIALNKSELTSDAKSTISSASASAPASVSASRPSLPTNAVAVDAASQFGLAAISQAAKIDKISSFIKGRFSSWQPNSQITLDNGQVWKVIDDSRGVCECDNPKVTISRASFGTFFLEIEGKGNAPRVKRIQ